jgi:3-oxo-5alpha-steroid 4-dehydrogenase
MLPDSLFEERGVSDRIDVKQAAEPAQAPLEVDGPEAIAWNEEVDIVIVGFGAAGASAAIEAKERELDALVIERFNGGGATAVSGGVIYSGGGTRIQKEAGIEDGVEEMVRYLETEIADAVSTETLREFCETSVETFAWLERHGLEFKASLCPKKTSYPLDKYCLYFSGNEGFLPHREKAKPAPRGHRVIGKGLAGASFFSPLQKSVQGLGIPVHYQSRVTRLVRDRSGAVLGVEYRKIPGRWTRKHARFSRLAAAMTVLSGKLSWKMRNKCVAIDAEHGETRYARARRGVVLSAGGFIHNREMLEEYAPRYRKGMRVGTLGDNGSGICLGQSVGGAVAKMENVSAWRFLNPPEAFARGILVNRKGERYINEMRYGATTGHAMVEHNGGEGFVIMDAKLKRKAYKQLLPGRASWFQSVPAFMNLFFYLKRGDTIEAAAKAARLDPEGVRKSVNAYNRIARGEEKDPFGKDAEYIDPIETSPFYVLDCSITSRGWPLPCITMGGLEVDEKSGQVKSGSGGTIEGLYAAGRTAVGICSNGYISGLAIADCVYSGRRVARALAD